MCLQFKQNIRKERYYKLKILSNSTNPRRCRLKQPRDRRAALCRRKEVLQRLQGGRVLPSRQRERKMRKQLERQEERAEHQAEEKALMSK
jgi:hypothetical protein